MKLIGLTSAQGRKVGIPLNKINGFCEVIHDSDAYGKTFIVTGTDIDGNEDGWHVKEHFNEVWMLLEATKD